VANGRRERWCVRNRINGRGKKSQSIKQVAEGEGVAILDL
jgi:hypothetical protein